MISDGVETNSLCQNPIERDSYVLWDFDIFISHSIVIWCIIKTVFL